MALDSECPNARLFDLNRFADFGYDEPATVRAALAVLPTYEVWIPTDYRTLEEIHRRAHADDEVVGSDPSAA